MVPKVSSSTTSGLVHLKIHTLQQRQPLCNPAQGIPRNRASYLTSSGDADWEVKQHVQCNSQHDLAWASLDHQHRQELNWLEEVLARRTLQCCKPSWLWASYIRSRSRNLTNWRRCWHGENCSKTLLLCNTSLLLACGTWSWSRNLTDWRSCWHRENCSRTLWCCNVTGWRLAQ